MSYRKQPIVNQIYPEAHATQFLLIRELLQADSDVSYVAQSTVF